ncbi:arsenical pump-driving ATPase [Cellulomonas soli]|uniref:Arsenical pump-driving ATPase n=1 Tax=Cellulomonas soli TaxID=931535 RepID=A0A512PG84_9CELL|nr:arsenical pump-driving ATPase [Cellulomonas soli]NYI58073.1 arsenite-transporting ATPase [Cellulomonas soli]GEP70208.1 arsenical pump-driving ATPase [Cellulomonas soli]
MLRAAGAPPRFLVEVPRFVFLTGKGGVGKTSIACAAAVALARSGKQVLLVSTDPASNVGQVFGVRIGHTITAVEDVPGLSALEIDPAAAAADYRERIVGPVREILPPAEVTLIEEQLSGACTTEIASFNEFTALLTDEASVAGFDHVVFDTAPTGHTIRLLQLPTSWTGFLEEGKGDASCLGPLAGLDRQREVYARAVAALADPGLTRLVLVTRAQQAAVDEAARTHVELAQLGLGQQHLVVNAVLPRPRSGDRLARAVFDREQTVLAALPAGLAALPRDVLELKAENLVGLPALSTLFEPAPATDELPGATTPTRVPASASTIADLVEEIAEQGHGLVMVMGKGGVGKTTVAAAVAVALAERGLPVLLTTTDPAAHLSRTLEESAPNLEVSRIDPVVETERYRRSVLRRKGAALDDAGRASLEEDLRSPCTEEIAVFQAFSQVVHEGRRRFVVIDTAPTGHTLLLLDATGSYHRDVVRQRGPSSASFTTPMMRLQDPGYTKMIVVTLPEATPVLEAEELAADLRRAGVEPWAWVVNSSLLAADTSDPLLLRRAAAERGPLARVLDGDGRRCAVVEQLADEPVGAAALRDLVRGSAARSADVG